MQITPRRIAGAVASAFLVFGVGFVNNTASAVHVSCGQTITQSTTLHNDVGPCTTDGIIIGADNITLDLNGHRVFGIPGPSEPSNALLGDVAGIRLPGRTGVQVKNGRVTDFDAGVAIVGGSTNKISGITARDNIGGVGDFGDGIAISGSNNNTVMDNNVVHNGPYDGIGMFAGSSGNTINKNTVTDNNIPNGPMNDIGIRVEGPGSANNTVSNNQILRNGLDGVTVFGFTGNTGNVVKHNTIQDNGNHPLPQRKGSGIAAPALSSLIQDNIINRNGGHGIRMGGKSSQILTNKTGGNGLGNGQPCGGPGCETYYDLFDANTVPPCDANVWSGNTYLTFNQPCVTA